MQLDSAGVPMLHLCFNESSVGAPLGAGRSVRLSQEPRLHRHLAIVGGRPRFPRQDDARGLLLGTGRADRPDLQDNGHQIMCELAEYVDFDPGDAWGESDQIDWSLTRYDTNADSQLSLNTVGPPGPADALAGENTEPIYRRRLLPAPSRHDDDRGGRHQRGPRRRRARPLQRPGRGRDADSADLAGRGLRRRRAAFMPAVGVPRPMAAATASHAKNTNPTTNRNRCSATCSLRACPRVTGAARSPISRGGPRRGAAVRLEVVDAPAHLVDHHVDRFAGECHELFLQAPVVTAGGPRT